MNNELINSISKIVDHYDYRLREIRYRNDPEVEQIKHTIDFLTDLIKRSERSEHRSEAEVNK